MEQQGLENEEVKQEVKVQDHENALKALKAESEDQGVREVDQHHHYDLPPAGASLYAQQVAYHQLLHQEQLE